MESLPSTPVLNVHGLLLTTMASVVLDGPPVVTMALFMATGMATATLVSLRKASPATISHTEVNLVIAHALLTPVIGAWWQAWLPLFMPMGLFLFALAAPG